MILLRTISEEYKSKFIKLNSERSVADLLEIKYSSLIYYVRKISSDKKYTKFCVPKKSGGEREIYAPIEPLKLIQRRLNFILQNIYEPNYCVHGFIKNRDIVTNTKNHSKQKYLLNVDLKDFFPSINFGRVRGIFMVYPFIFSPTVATLLAQICCFNNQLPQGAPTSPIISNFICARMDRQLLNFSQGYKCRYTRYADDLSFSTYLHDFPFIISENEHNDEDERINRGEEFKNIVSDNGFEINFKKVRLRNNKQRLEVTGLTANRFPNVNRKLVRQIRAMLHAWKKFGLEKAEEEYFKRYDNRYRHPEQQKPSFKDILVGKISFIGMVRGRTNQIYKKLYFKVRDLDPTIKMKIGLEGVPFIITEGSSDWKYLKAALKALQKNGEFLNLNMEFSEYENFMGSQELLKICKEIRLRPQPRINILIFDRDLKIITSVAGWKTHYRNWGNNVYSFVLPKPTHRQNEDISPELYFKDEEIKTKDSYGRRLFLSKEFDKISGKHISEDCRYSKVDKLNNENIFIIDSDVSDSHNPNIALSKNNFAKNILSESENFSKFDFSEFKKIFEIIERIIEESKNHYL